jgi:hypothetical protein
VLSRRRLARSSRFSSRATPPIQIARLTPPDIAVANRISCVAGDTFVSSPAIARAA